MDGKDAGDSRKVDRIVASVGAMIGMVPLEKNGCQDGVSRYHSRIDSLSSAVGALLDLW